MVAMTLVSAPRPRLSPRLSAQAQCPPAGAPARETRTAPTTASAA